MSDIANFVLIDKNLNIVDTVKEELPSMIPNHKCSRDQSHCLV